MDFSHWCFWEKRHIFQSRCSATPFHSDIMWRHRYVSHGKKTKRDFPLNPGCWIGILFSITVYEIMPTYCFNGSFWVLEAFCWFWYHFIPKKHPKIWWTASRGPNFNKKNFCANQIPQKSLSNLSLEKPQTPSEVPPSVMCFKGSGIPSTSSTLSSSSIDTQVLGAAGAWNPRCFCVIVLWCRVWKLMHP